MSQLFNALLYQPFLNALIFLYETAAFNDLGVAIILLTLVIRLILYPLFYRSYKNQTVMQKMQPEIKQIQEKHRHNKQQQTEALLALYKRHKVNPFSSFFLILVQLPVLIALYRLFLNDLSGAALDGLYSFVSRPDALNHAFLNLINLREPNIIVVGLSAAAQFIQSKMALPKAGAAGGGDQAARVAKNMVYIGPAITLFVLYSLPAAVGLYWFATSVFSVFQQVLINKSLNKKQESPENHGTASRQSQKNT